jgi:hypothetical protein
MVDEQKVTRKLRAIFSADVKGYSILMADDEVATIQTLKQYPIEKVENDCEEITPENLSTKSILPIEKLAIYSQDQLYDFINSYNENQKIPDKIFEVSHVSSDISEIYWFARIDQQRTSPNSIAGVYEDKSTNLYYMTVAPAI